MSTEKVSGSDNGNDTHGDHDQLAAERVFRNESVDWFSNKNKPEREKWVVAEHLTNLGIPFNDDDIVEGADPPDVVFRDAKFEIKEILTQGRRRHDEYKQKEITADNAANLGELLEPYAPQSITIEALYARLIEDLNKLSYSPDKRCMLDLLLYVNLDNVNKLIEEPFPDVSELQAMCFRSIGFVMGWRSATLFARADSPSFLSSNIRRIAHRASS